MCRALFPLRLHDSPNPSVVRFHSEWRCDFNHGSGVLFLQLRHLHKIESPTFSEGIMLVSPLGLRSGRGLEFECYRFSSQKLPILRVGAFPFFLSAICCHLPENKPPLFSTSPSTRTSTQFFWGPTQVAPSRRPSPVFRLPPISARAFTRGRARPRRRPSPLRWTYRRHRFTLPLTLDWEAGFRCMQKVVLGLYAFTPVQTAWCSKLVSEYVFPRPMSS